MKRSAKFIHLGIQEYQKAVDFQHAIFQKNTQQKIINRKGTGAEQKKIENHLIMCYHPNTYTIGKSGNRSNMLVEKQFLDEIQATFCPTNRGGDITYHGPGQVVVYPIFDLEQFVTDIQKYIRSLEECVLLTLKEYGLQANRIQGLTGVWIHSIHTTKATKICAIGVRCSRWVTMHGLALNVNTNLKYFDYIVPCGIRNHEVTSMEKELGKPVNMFEVEKKLKRNFARVFDLEWIEPPDLDAVSTDG